jgi:hypothetical protein
MMNRVDDTRTRLTDQAIAISENGIATTRFPLTG